MDTRRKKVLGARPSSFARSLLDEWRRRGWPREGERVVVAVSGGADSAALLLALEELTRLGLLGVAVTAAHLDHGLRAERGAADAEWVAEFARGLGFETVAGRASVGELAEAARDNLEQAAREARYEFLARAAREAGAHAVLTGHTLDDQAETVMLRLLRGSGAEGLGGMRAERKLEEGGEVFLRRPLLSWARRADTEALCRARGVTVRTDEMNDDECFARVRMRRRLMPLLESFNPRAAEALSRAAELLREDSAALDTLASELLERAGGDDAEAAHSDAEAANSKDSVEARAELIRPLRVEVLRDAAPALRRRALRLWLARARGLRRIGLAHLAGVERLLEGARGGRIAELPGGSRVERRRGLLIFSPKNVEKGGVGT